MATLTGLTCTGGKTLLGSQGASCNNGVLTWSAPQDAKPECIGEFTGHTHLLSVVMGDL